MALAAKQHVINFHLMDAGDMNYEAWHGFGALGTNAYSAVPQLADIYARNFSDMSRRCSAYSLGGMGPAAAAAVPVFLQVAADTNAKTSPLEDREEAIGMLGEIHSSPQIVVPVLTNLLADSTVCVDTVAALGKFGPDAISSLPLLNRLLNDPNKMVRLYAIEAIKRIAPAEAEHRQAELKSTARPRL